MLQSKFNADYSHELNNTGESLDTVIDQEVDNSRFEDKLAEIEDLPAGFDSIDSEYDDGGKSELPSASPIKPDANSKNGPSDRLKQVKDMTSRVYDEPSGSDGLSLG